MRRGRSRGINWRSRCQRRVRYNYPQALGRGLDLRYLRSDYTRLVYQSRCWTSPTYGYRPSYTLSYPDYSYQRTINPSYGYY